MDVNGITSVFLHTDNMTEEYNITQTLDSVGQFQYNAVYLTVMRIEMVVLPIICIIGLIGNTLSTATFLRKPLRNSPCSIYLALRGVSDNGFLFSLLLIWLSSTFDLKLSHVTGVCQLIIFSTYLFGCVSVWLCVFITVENFFIINKPYIAKSICTQRVAKICILTLIVIAVGCYNTSLWVMNGDCSHNANFSALTQILVYTDTLFTLIIPTILIFSLLLVISYKLIYILRLRTARYDRVKSSNSSNCLGAYVTRKQPRPIQKVTEMLYVVSLTFFILNVPSHVVRLRLLIGSFTKGYMNASHTEASVQVIFQLIYYLSFSVNIFVYMTFGSNFRRTFGRTFCCYKERPRLSSSSTEAVNLVRLRRHSISGNVGVGENTSFLSIPIIDRCHSHS